MASRILLNNSYSLYRSINNSSQFLKSTSALKSGAGNVIVGAGAGGYRSTPVLQYLSSRSIHLSTVRNDLTTSQIGPRITTGAGGGSQLPEISVQPVDVGESIQGLSSSGGAGITDTVNTTLEGPGASIGFIFSDSAPVLFSQDLLYQLKDIPGMEWTSTIILTTIGIRLFVGLPIAVTQQKSIGKLQLLQPEMKELATNLARETSIAVKLYNWDKRRANSAFKKSFKKHCRNLMELHNCHPMRGVALGLLQIPFWVCLSGAIRNVVYCLPNPATPEMIARWSQIAAESTPWLDSLTATDPLVFPLIFLVSNLLNIQLNSMRKLAVPQTKTQIIVPWVFRFGVTGIALFAMFTPSAVTLYWATSSLLALLQNLLLKINRVRIVFGLLPITPPPPPKPVDVKRKGISGILRGLVTRLLKKKTIKN